MGMDMDMGLFDFLDMGLFDFLDLYGFMDFIGTVTVTVVVTVTITVSVSVTYVFVLQYYCVLFHLVHVAHRSFCLFVHLPP